MNKSKLSLKERVEEKYIAEPMSGCWLWLGTLNSDGYGLFSINSKLFMAHRIAYELFKDKIPNRLTLDHLCRVRCCINPNHLEPVTLSENILRSIPYRFIQGKRYGSKNRNLKKFCKNGHEFTPENTYLYKRGGRDCKTCSAEAKRRYEKRIKLSNNQEVR